MIKMRKELNSQNERLQFQEKRIDDQDKKILLLESLHPENNKIDDERVVDNNPTYNINLFTNTNGVIEREKRAISSSKSSVFNSSSPTRSNYIKIPPRLCTSLFDPERPDAAIVIRGRTVQQILAKIHIFTKDTFFSTKGRLLGEPSNCYDLRLNGHYLNGFYSVKNDGNIETIFCDFSGPTVEGITCF